MNYLCPCIWLIELAADPLFAIPSLARVAVSLLVSFRCGALTFQSGLYCVTVFVFCPKVVRSQVLSLSCSLALAALCTLAVLAYSS